MKRRTRLANCTAKSVLGHASCHGYLNRWWSQPAVVIVCECECGHKPSGRLIDSGTLRVPPGYTAESLKAEWALHGDEEQ